MLQVPINDIVARIADTCPLLHGAAHALRNTLSRTYPYAHIKLLSEQASNNLHISNICQEIRAIIAIDILVANAARNDIAGPAGEEVMSVRSQIHDSLINWTPNQNCSPFIFVNGKLDRIADSIVIWRDTFLTTFYREQL